MIKKLIIVILLGILSSQSFAQEKDSVYIFNEYLKDIMDSNPRVIQTKALFDQADGRLTAAAGLFDPKFYSKYSQKSINGTDYYQKLETGIEYKTASPFTLNAGFTENRGTYLNGENFTSDTYLLNLGVSLDIGRGLFTDEERTKFAVAKSERNQIKAMAYEDLNQFYFDASYVYWKWVETFYVLRLYEEMLALAEFRKRGVVSGFINGDRSAADTLEAHTVVQQRRLSVRESYLKFSEAKLKLEAYTNTPLDSSFVPDEIALKNMVSLNREEINLKEFIQNHPLRSQYEAKLEMNNSKFRLKKEQFRPELQVYYNYLSNDKQVVYDDVTDQSMFGAKFSLPLFFRKERGGYQEFKAKVKESKYALEWTELKLQAMIEQEIVQVNTYLNLFLTNNYYARDLFRLLEYEKQLFRIGESSLFVVNSREYKYALAEVAKIKSYTEYKLQLERWKTVNGTAFNTFLN